MTNRMSDADWQAIQNANDRLGRAQTAADSAAAEFRRVWEAAEEKYGSQLGELCEQKERA